MVWSKDVSLVNGSRQKIQLTLAFPEDERGEAPRASGDRVEPCAATDDTRDPVKLNSLMEAVLERTNLTRALHKIQSNRGSRTPGVDGLPFYKLAAYLRKHWPTIKADLESGSYQPFPVKRVEIPKPGGPARRVHSPRDPHNSGRSTHGTRRQSRPPSAVRKLGIPTALDRLIQQAVLQVLQPIFDPTFSDHSYGFRPGRSAHQAVAKAQSYQSEGYRWIVDMDLSKFFDRVNHDRLMARLAERISDASLLKLIRSFLTAGVLEDGLVSSTDEGTPQGGPLSPLLSNIVLDELDRELERRGHRFVRYADDSNVYVRTRRAGKRVMTSITRFVTDKLRLKVNEAKSAVDRPWNRKFLGFSFTPHRQPKRRLAPATVQRFKAKVRQLTRRTRGGSLEALLGYLRSYLLGWRGYFGFAETRSVLRDLDSWLRRRLRSLLWKRWKISRVRFAELTAQGVSRDLAAQTCGSPHSPWRLSRSPALNIALPNALWKSLGLPTLAS